MKFGDLVFDVIVGGSAIFIGLNVYSHFFNSEPSGYNFNDDIGSYTEIVDRVENFKDSGIIECDNEGNEYKVFYDKDTLIAYRRIELDKFRYSYQEILGKDKKPMNIYEYKESRRIYDCFM